MVVHGKDGLDKITTTGVTTVAELKNGKVRVSAVAPEDFGFARAKPEDLKGADPELNAKIALDILKGKKGFKRDVVILNAGAAIYVTEAAGSVAEGVEKAKASIDSGRAMEKLEKLRELTNK